MGKILTLDIDVTDPGFPDAADFYEPVPIAGLVDVWRASVGATTANGSVSAWVGKNGSTITQATGAKQPTHSDDGIAAGIAGITSDGVDDYLLTPNAPPASGVIALALKTPASLSGTRAFAGSQTSAGNTIAIGHSTGSLNLGAAIGDVSFAGFSGPPLTASTKYVVLLSWSAGSAKLRLNGAQVATTSYAGTVGLTAITLGARKNGASFDLFSDSSIGAYALYNVVKSDSQLQDIEEAMAALIGLSL